MSLNAERLELRLLLSGVPTAWSAQGSGGGGALFSPSIDPANPSEMFISSDMGELFQTADSGASWQMLNFGQIQGGHENQVQFTDNPKILYAVDYTSINGSSAQASKSTDGGATWTPLANDPTGGNTYKLFADTNNNSHLLVSDYTHLYASLDGGSTWSTVYTTTNTGAGLHVAGAYFNGANIYVGTSDGLLISNNSGASFNAASVSGIPSGQAILSLAGATQNGTTRLIATTRASANVYAGIQGYDYKYADSVYTLVVGQSSWTAAMTGISASSYTTYVAMAQNNTNVAYLAGGGTAGTPVVYKTTDGGAHWSQVLLTFNNQNVATGWSGSGGDRGWTYGEVALGLDVAANDANHLLVTDLGFAHQSTDGGADWSQLYVNPSDQNAEGSLISPGKSYRDSGLDNTSSWNVDWVDANNVIVGNTDIGGTHSTNGGTSFAHFASGNAYNTTYWTVVQPSTGTVYGATSSIHDMYQSTHLTDASIDSGNGAVLYSTDKGATWQTLHNFNHPVVYLALDPNNANRLYASVVSSTAGGIYVTNDLQDGANSVWTELPAPSRTQGHPLDVQVLNDGSVVATFSGRRAGSPLNFTNSSGVFLYNPANQTWTDVSAPQMDYWTQDLTIDPGDATQSTWYVGVFSGWGGAANGLGGLYKTTNRGQTWTQLLSLDGVSSVSFNPANSNELFVATESEGLWYSSNAQSASPTIAAASSYPFRQPERVFFNPFDPSKIWVTSFGGGVLVGNSNPPQNGNLQFSSATYSGTDNGSQATITVTRTNGSTGAVTVHYATSDGTAHAQTDYAATSGTLNFADGQTTATFNVPILNDPAVDGTETVNLTLTSPTGGATLGTPSTAVLNILDPPGALQFNAANYQVVETQGSALITLTRTVGDSGAVTVHYATSDGTAKAGTDYSSTSGTASFADGQTTTTFSVPILKDPTNDGPETVFLALTNPTGGAVLGNQTNAILNIGDAPGALQFSGATYTVGDNGKNATITVNRIGGNGGAVSVQYATSNGTATAGTDYASTSGTLNFADGQNSATFTVPLLNDPADDGTETVNLTLSNAAGGATLGTQSTAVLNIVDGPGGLQFSASTYNATEGGPAATITVTRTGGSGGPVSVHYATSGGTAIPGSTYTPASGTLNFADGQASATFTVPILNDGINDHLTTVNLTLSSPAGGATLGTPSSAVLDIQDAPGSLQFSAPSYSVSDGAGTATITVNRSAGDGGPVSVHYATSDGTAKAGTDYTSTSGTLSFADGQTSATFSIPILLDPNLTGPATLNLTLSTPAGGAALGTQSTATLNITPAAGTFQFSSPTYNAAENGGSAQVTVSRVGGSTGAVTIDYTTSDGTAKAGTDYTLTRGTLSFADGQTSATFNVPILGDPTPDGTESVNLALSNPTGGAVLGSASTAVLQIHDIPGTLQFGFATYGVAENGGLAYVNVVRRGGNGGAVSVHYTTSDGTATAGTDYTSTSGTLNFADGQNSATFTIPILGDPADDGTETVNLALSSAAGGATLGTANTAVLNIFDQPGVFQFSAATANVPQNARWIPITVSRSGGNGGAVSVNYATADGTARAGLDYVAVAGTLNFADGQNSATFSVPILNDLALRGAANFKITLTNPTNGAKLGTTATEIVRILAVPHGAPGDFNGSGTTDPGVYRTSTSQWFVQANGWIPPVLGASTLLVPVPGDYDHVGYAEPAVFRPSTGEWIVLGPNGTHVVATFGSTNLSDIPVPGDYDGVGYTEPAVFRPSTGEWFVLGPNGGHQIATFGGLNLTDIPAQGDFDHVGYTEPAVFRPSTAQWIVLGPNGGHVLGTFGAPNLFDIPVAGDYDGVGYTEPAVFRPSTAQWIVLGPNGGRVLTQFGAAGLTNDIPLETSIGSLQKLGVIWGPQASWSRPSSIAAFEVQSAPAPAPVAVTPAYIPIVAPPATSSRTKASHSSKHPHPSAHLAWLTTFDRSGTLKPARGLNH